ncbi:MAG: hypothetical protein AAGI54_02420 [Planctomycetota bacterium]
MNEPRDDRRVVMRYKPAPRSVGGWLREAGAWAADRAGSAAVWVRGVRLQRGWWVGPTGVVMLGLAGWVAFGPASVGTRPTGLGPRSAEGRGIDLSTGVPPEVAFAEDEAAGEAAGADEAGATEAVGPLVIDLRAAAAETEATADQRTEASGETETEAEAEAEAEVEVEAAAIAERPGVEAAILASPEPAKQAAAQPTAMIAAVAVVSAEFEAVPVAQARPTAMATELEPKAEPVEAPTATEATQWAEVDASLAMGEAEPSWPWPSAVASARSEPTAGSAPDAREVAAEAVALAKPVPPAPPAESRTQRVVYMVDLSGSLVDSLPEAVRWIGEALDGLEQPAVFTVLFFREGEVIEAPPYGLKPATFAMKWEAYDWMRPETGHVEAGGKATLSDAVLAALRYEVDRVVLLSDDGFGRGLSWVGGPTLLDEIALTLPNAGTRIDTVQFFYRDRAGAMEAIADRFGGEYTFIGVALPDDDPAFVDLYGRLRTR